MHVDLIDPSAYTPPYDRALAGALALAGANVRLLTSEFPYGQLGPPPAGVTIERRFYRRARGAAGSRVRRFGKVAQHLPDMLAYRREIEAAVARSGEVRIAHFQWLTLPQIDGRLLPRGLPVVLTAHDVLPREPTLGQVKALRRLYGRVDAVVVHSEHGRRRLIDEIGLDEARVHVIHHGAFAALAALDRRLPPELTDTKDDGPIALLPGLLRPYKGLDVLLDAWRHFGSHPPGRLWICGLPRMSLPTAEELPPAVTLVPRFLTDAELAGVLDAADLVVLPYREIDQSGMLYAALGLGRPLLLSAVGGFPEVAALGAAALTEAADPSALAADLARLLADERERARLRARAQQVAVGQYSFNAAADAHLKLYATLTA